MKLSATYKQNLKDYMIASYIFIGIMILVTVLVGVLISVENSDNPSGSIGFDFSSAIFVLISAMCFKDNMLFSIQNGVSRKTFHIANILSIITVGALLSLVPLVGELVVSFIPNVNITLFNFSEITKATDYLKLFILMFSLLIAFSGVGLFLGAMNSRTTKIQKFIIYGLSGALLLFVFPMADGFLFDSKVISFIAGILGYIGSKPFIMFLSSMGILILLSYLSWLFIRKIEFN